MEAQSLPYFPSRSVVCSKAIHLLGIKMCVGRDSKKGLQQKSLSVTRTHPQSTAGRNTCMDACVNARTYTRKTQRGSYWSCWESGVIDGPTTLVY